MKEIILTRRKGGMTAMFIIIFINLLALAMMIYGGMRLGQSTVTTALFVLGSVIICIGWIPFLGLKILRPQEALVFTLFGKYVGTLKGAGFYFVNPFCVAVNPAAGTRLNQSGDVKKEAEPPATATVNAANLTLNLVDRRISLKIMTLSNTRQKINDCLGNPVEIGIAVIWRVVDTAKAVFNVDNYKEYLSLQCDTALRNIVRLYPLRRGEERGYDRRRLPRRRLAPGQQRSRGGAHPRRDPEQGQRSRPRDPRSAHHVSGLFDRDRGGNAAAAAGIGDNRRAENDR